MRFLILLMCVVFVQEDKIPYKPNEEFDLKLKFEFKERTRVDPNKVDLEQTQKELHGGRGGGLLPYLFLNLQLLKQATGETRVKVFEGGSRQAYNKKVDLSTVIKLDLGFTDDIKDRVSPHEYKIIFYNDGKDPLSTIVIFFQEDGTYLVNGQIRGKL